MPAGAEAVDVADEGDESGGSQDSDAGDGEQSLDGGDLSSESANLVVGIVHERLEAMDLLTSLVQGMPQSHRDLRIGVFDQGANVGDDVFGSERDKDTELAEDASDGVDVGGTGSEPSGAKPVQGGEGLLLDGFDGDGVDILVAKGLEKAFGVGTVGLVAMNVGPDVLRGKKNDVVSEVLNLSGPAMGHPAGFHHDIGGLALGEEGKKAGPAEAMGFRHLARAVRDRDLEDVLCNIHGDRRMLHFRTPPCYWFNETVHDFGTRCRLSRGRSPSHQIERTIGASILVKERRKLAPLAAHPPC
jgi:hypothetical protein